MNKRFFFLVFVIILITVYTIISYQTPDKIIVALPVDNMPSIMIENIETVIEQDQAVISEAPFDCLAVKKDIQKKSNLWNVKIIRQGDDLISAGYNADEVTLAIEHFNNKNHASSWREAFHKKNSFSRKKQKLFTEKVEALMGRLMPDGISLGMQYPRPQFAGFKQLDHQEKLTLLDEHPPVVDDIAAYIRDKSLTENELLLMLSYIDSPNQMIGSSDFQLMTLLDYSVAYELINVFDYLVNKGAEPTEDFYNINTMERALRALHYRIKDKSDIANTVKIVSTLKEMGSRAKFKVTSDESVLISPNSVLESININRNTIQFLLNEYDLDILGIQHQEVPDKNNLKSGIIESLKSEKLEYLLKNIVGYTYFKNHC